jgi:hypothetical protein
VKFFLDNNLPPNWAACLSAASNNQFAGAQVECVTHLKDSYARNTPDVVWIEDLARQKDWVVISGDAFRKSNSAERKVLRSRGLSVFVMQSSWSSHPYWEKSAQLLLWWPRIVAQAHSAECVAMEVPWRSASRFRQM